MKINETHYYIYYVNVLIKYFKTPSLQISVDKVNTKGDYSQHNKECAKYKTLAIIERLLCIRLSLVLHALFYQPNEMNINTKLTFLEHCK